MHVLTVEVENENGVHLLQEFEKLHVLRIVNEDVSVKKTRLSEKYAGTFSKEDALSFNKHTQTMRGEWSNI